MSSALAQKIAEGAKIRESYPEDLKMAFAFAKLELSELAAGIREFHQCPGLERVAREITRANTHIKPADTRS